MGLKETLKQQEPSIKQENSSEVMEMKTLIEEQSGKIQRLSFTNSELQASNQTLQSELTKASEQIESLTSRAASVNLTELQNKKLLKEAHEAKALSDKALQEAERARKEARSYYERSQQANRERQEEALEKRKAKDEARSAHAHAYYVKMTYKSLFLGQMIFCSAMAFFMAYGKRGVLQEMGQWFPDRGKDFTGVLMWLRGLFMALADFPPAKWHTATPWGYVFALVVTIIAGAGLFFLFCFLQEKISGFWQCLKLEYNDGTFMAVTSADIALVLFYVCLFFHDGLAKAFPLNILSVWILFSIIGVAAWNGTHIVRAVKK